MAEAEYKSEIDQYGFERPETFDYNSHEEFMADYLRVLARRAAKWEHMLNGKSSLKRSNKVKRYIRKGIPSEHRAEVWLAMSGAKEQLESHKGLYLSLVNDTNGRDQSVADTIEKDITRTFPENIYFKEVQNSQLNSLRNVLNAFAQHNKDIGYCQGINYIVGMLLLVTKNEEQCFWILNQLLQFRLPDFYRSRMIGLRVECATLTEFLRLRHPELHMVFKSHNIDLDLMVSKWFICLFMDVLPVETVLRIWDCLFYEGSKVLLRVALSILIQNKEEFLQLKEFTDICTLFKTIIQDSNVLKCHEFMQGIFTIPGSLSMAQVKAIREKCREDIEKAAI